jgi:hypothetical protein
MRMVMRPLAPAPALALALAGCKREPPPPSEAEVTQRARAAIGPFQSALKTELGKALAESPQAAIEVCAKRAPELAREHSRDGVRVGRSAQRLRNPENAAPAWLAPVMDDLAKAPSGSEAHAVVALPGGRQGYAEAIWIGPPCLVCHGQTIAPEVEAKLRERYPKDEARGYAPGEFRGVFWAEIDAPHR